MTVIKRISKYLVSALAAMLLIIGAVAVPTEAQSRLVRASDLPEVLPEHISRDIFNDDSAITASGVEETFSWTVSAKGTLSISGNGPVTGGFFSKPWDGCYVVRALINEGITEIGEHCFTDMPYLQAVWIPSTVTVIRWGAFMSCSRLEQIELPASISRIESFAFSDTRWLYNMQQRTPLVSVNGILVDGEMFEEDRLVIPDWVKCIAGCAFWYNNHFRYVEIPEGVTEIGYQAFLGTTTIEEVRLPKSLSLIEKDAFNRNIERVNTVYYGGTASQWDQLVGEDNLTLRFADVHCVKEPVAPEPDPQSENPQKEEQPEEPNDSDTEEVPVDEEIKPPTENDPSSGEDSRGETDPETTPKESQGENDSETSPAENSTNREERDEAVTAPMQTEEPPVSTPTFAVDDTAVGEGASAISAAAAITGAKSDEGPSGTTYYALQARVKKSTKTSLTIGWKKVPGATQYVVYGAKCGQKFAELARVTGASYKQTGLRKSTYYKYMVMAVKGSSDAQVVEATSKTVHAITAGGKKDNYKAVKVSKKTVRLAKKGKKITVRATGVAKKGKTTKAHRKIAYESTNTNVAKVSKAGKITAVGKGSCVIYAYAADGTSAKIKVSVKK